MTDANIHGNNETRNGALKMKREMKDYCFPATDGYGSCIRGPPIEAKILK